MRKLIVILVILAVIGAVGIFAIFNIGPPLHPPSDISDLIASEDSPIVVKDISDIENEVLIERDLGVVLRDGTRLSANVFRPKAPGQYPVVMAITAYHKDEGLAQYPAHLRNHLSPQYDLGKFEISPWTPWEGPDPAYWVEQGYAVVTIDARGYGKSGGVAGVLSIQDRYDFHDAITWAGTQGWSNGNVGLTGVSYLAIVQWIAGADAPAYLKAIMPWEGTSDAFRETLFHGGIPETVFTRFWMTRVRSKANETSLPPHVIMDYAGKRPLLMKSLQERRIKSGISLEEITVPALICASWSDHGMHTRGSIEGFKRIASEKKWLYTHGRSKWEVYYSAEALEYQTAFFDRFLKEENNGFEERPRVRLEIRDSLDSYTVRDEKEWPLASTVYTPLFLKAENNSTDGTLVDDEQAAPSQLTYDALKGRATFRKTFTETSEVTGHMKLKLWVEANNAEDMDLFVAVKKYDVQGEEVTFYGKAGYVHHPVALGWMRVSHRQLDAEHSTPEQPVQAFVQHLPLESGQIVPVEIEILASSTRFMPGEVLEVVVQGHQHFDHHSLGYEHIVNEGEHIIHTGGVYDSHLLVPFIPSSSIE